MYAGLGAFTGAALPQHVSDVDTVKTTLQIWGRPDANAGGLDLRE